MDISLQQTLQLIKWESQYSVVRKEDIHFLSYINLTITLPCFYGNQVQSRKRDFVNHKSFTLDIKDQNPVQTDRFIQINDSNDQCSGYWSDLCDLL